MPLVASKLKVASCIPENSGLTTAAYGPALNAPAVKLEGVLYILSQYNSGGTHDTATR
jgi:hypothetical protein